MDDPEKKIFLSGRFLYDLYALSIDILENQQKQRNGYKSNFYYTFNPNLKLLLCDSSYIDQMYLLTHLQDREMLTFEEITDTTDQYIDFVSSNVKKYKDSPILWLEIDTYKFNENLGIFLQYLPNEVRRGGYEELPKVLTKFNDDFQIHDMGVISYKSLPIDIPPQLSRIASFIMERSLDKRYTPIVDIIDECLSESYLEKTAQKVGAPEDYVRRSISQLRVIFRNTTQSQDTKDFFPGRRGIGYIFRP